MATNIQTETQSQVTKLLQNRVALVTSANRGIGAATAKLLARHGAAVGVNYYSSESTAQQVIDYIKNSAVEIVAYAFAVCLTHSKIQGECL